MRSSNDVDVRQFTEEVGYRLEVVALSLKKMDLSYLSGEELYESTFNQINFLEGKKLPKDIPVSEYPDAVNLYHDVLESLLNDLKSDKKELKFDAIYTYQRLRQVLYSEIGAMEHESILCDVSSLLNYMYNVVNARNKKRDYFKDL